jgi:hypothetical protein
MKLFLILMIALFVGMAYATADAFCRRGRGKQ